MVRENHPSIETPMYTLPNRRRNSTPVLRWRVTHGVDNMVSVVVFVVFNQPRMICR
ncbi:hypothetical protein Hanom_Chr10g00875491 [Helianthus anomalus]